ncbi:RNA polymerase sigma factor [Flavobacterium sp. I3-2]|uniref:RNA polymerase sigma factor n=1 Tax=Flavobacterium sp. I3-2 TaxID=2748319 RepID=UPI0015A90923|nr:RNA polymerase sigma factor [Flavobacterium sp. I3-2]
MKIIPIKYSEEKLIEQVKQQNRLAQKQLYDRFSPKLLSTCRQYIKDIHEAEDVMLMGFMKILQNINQYQFAGSFEGWMRRIMIYESIDFIRQKKQIAFSEDVSYKEACHFENDSLYEVEAIQKLIDDLPEGCKMVFVLSIVEGYKHQEIAEMLQISVGTSKSQLAHARKLLQERIQLQDKKIL